MTAKPLARRVAVIAAIGAAAAGMTPVAMATTGQAGLQALPITRGPYAQTPDSNSEDDGRAHPKGPRPLVKNEEKAVNEEKDSKPENLSPQADSGSAGRSQQTAQPEDNDPEGAALKQVAADKESWVFDNIEGWPWEAPKGWPEEPPESDPPES
jgi:hypothetical protein